MKYYSRLSRIEEQKAKRKVFLYIVLTIAIVIGLFYFGANLLTGSLVFVKRDDTLTPSNNEILLPPYLVPLADFTNKDEIVVKGRAQPKGNVVIIVNNQKEHLDVNADGEFERSTRLKEGENTIYARSTSKNGEKESEDSTHYTVVLDKTPPTLSVVKPEDAMQFSGKDRSIEIQGTTEADAKVYVNGRLLIVDKSGKFASILSLNDGKNDIEIKSIDQAGNETLEKRSVTYAP